VDRRVASRSCHTAQLDCLTSPKRWRLRRGTRSGTVSAPLRRASHRSVPARQHPKLLSSSKLSSPRCQAVDRLPGSPAWLPASTISETSKCSLGGSVALGVLLAAFEAPSSVLCDPVPHPAEHVPRDVRMCRTCEAVHVSDVGIEIFRPSLAARDTARAELALSDAHSTRGRCSGLLR
jgi:hypothetical protein